jgi:hypothetical protein
MAAITVEKYLKSCQTPVDQLYPRVLHGMGSPGDAPEKIFDLYKDEDLDEPYIATSTDSSAGWMSLKPHYDPAYAYGYDDFLGYHETALWTKSGVGTPVVGVLTHGLGGQLRLTTSGAQNDSSMIWMANQPLVIAENLLVEARVNLAQIADTEFHFGIADAVDVDGNGNSIFFEYSSANASDPTYWHTGTNIANTVADNGKTVPGVVAALDSWVKLGILIATTGDSENPKAHMLINDVEVDDINMPDPVYECSPAFNIKTLASAAKSVDIDYCGWRIPREQNS